MQVPVAIPFQTVSRDAIHLVVARHAEDPAWLRRVPPGIRVFVYEKGSPAPVRPRRAAEWRALPNVGREAHTYLHHIVEHYDALPDIAVFSQGRPFDHVPDLHAFLRGLVDGTERVDGFRWLGFLIDEDDRTGSRLFRRWSKNPERRPLHMEAFWSRIFPGEPAPHGFVFVGGAHFAVRAEVVRRRPLAFYRRALDVAAGFPDGAHCFERAWDRVFGVDGIPPHIRAQPRPVYRKPIRRLLDELAGAAPLSDNPPR